MKPWLYLQITALPANQAVAMLADLSTLSVDPLSYAVILCVGDIVVSAKEGLTQKLANMTYAESVRLIRLQH